MKLLDLNNAAEPVKFYIRLIDDIHSNCIIKMLLFFSYVPYEQRYCDAKSRYKTFHIELKYVVVVVIVIVDQLAKCTVARFGARVR